MKLKVFLKKASKAVGWSKPDGVQIKPTIDGIQINYDLKNPRHCTWVNEVEEALCDEVEIYVSASLTK